MSIKLPLVGLYGGTFDPVHNGHLQIATSLLQHIPFSTIQLIPNLNPPQQKQPTASFKERVAMLELACEEQAKLSVNTIEGQRRGPSYSIDTVKLIRQTNPKALYCFILGADVFNCFNQWHCWQEFFDTCHLIVVNRPNHAIASDSWLKALLQQRQVTSYQSLLNKPAGAILLQQLPPSPINATAVRQALNQGHIAQLPIPEKVLNYIRQNQLYGVSL